MSTTDKTRIDALLVEVLRKPEDEREAFLDLVCRDDDNLRRELKDLLAASDEAADFLERPAVQVSETILTPLRESPGTMIGRYKLLQRIGEGGFGVVYMAEQTAPVKRKVALKIIKLGMDTKQVIARFEAERQALALMEHPNIAKVFDAGATETGRPYFVMELVRGVPITEYCDKNNLSTKDRLDLFTPVCNAIQHAHQKGIIHRDIKPSNVMVTLHDGKPVPKVIDFGIAKATDHRLTEKTLFTEYHQLIGTPAYMSPEQAEMSGLDVDTRTDIYSLGVLLYELLTGTTPFDPNSLREAAYGEIQRIIREVEPPKPSTRLSSLATEPGAPATGSAPSGSGPSSLAEIAKHRRTDPSALSRLMRGDLDWIVMKALEKDRTRRYETAKEFAKDVEHHLANEPILASPPGAVYKLRKFVKRNRVAVTAGSLVAAALVLGLLFSTIGFVQASRQRDRAIVAEQEQSRERQRAEEALAATEAARDKATLEAAKATRIQEFLQEMLASADPKQAKGADITVREVLDEAAQRIGGELSDHPAVEAAVRHTIGLTYDRLGRNEQAKEQFEIAVKLRRDPEVDDELELADSLRHLANLVQFVDKNLARSRTLHNEALSIRERRLGKDHPLTVEVLTDLAGTGYMTHDESTYADYAAEVIRRITGATLSDEELIPDIEHKLDKLSELWKQGRREEALGTVRSEMRPYVDSGLSMQTLVGMLVAFSQKRSGAGDYDAAEPLLHEAVRIAREANQPMYIAQALGSLGFLHLRKGDYAEAAGCFSEALELSKRIYGSEHEYTQQARFKLARSVRRLGKLAEAEVLYREILDGLRRTQPAGDVFTGVVLVNVGATLSAQGKHQEAEMYSREAMELFRRVKGASDAMTLGAMVALGSALEKTGNLGEADAVFRDLLNVRRSASLEGHPTIDLALIVLGRNLVRQERFAEAEPLLRECLEIRRGTLAQEHSWLIYNAMSILGECLTGRQNYQEAETLLLDACDGLHNNRDGIPESIRAERLLESVDRVVRLYETWRAAEPDAGHDRKAAEWRKKLAAEELPTPKSPKK